MERITRQVAYGKSDGEQHQIKVDSMGLRNSKMKLCPRCRLPMDEDDAVVCSM